MNSSVNSRLSKVAGMGAASMAALAALALGCVFAATAGPREALTTRTQALHQTLRALSPLAAAVNVTSSWNGVSSSLAAASFGAPDINITHNQFAEVTSELRRSFNHGLVHLAPASEDWAGMVSHPHNVSTNLPATKGLPVRLEIGYRDPFTRYTRLLAGSYPAAQAPPAAQPGERVIPQAMQVVVSRQMARDFGLHPGSTVRITGPTLALSGKLSTITIEVTGIIAPVNPGSTFWTADPTVLTPDLETPQNAPSFWVAEALAGPGEIDAVQQAFGPEGLDMEWELPLQVGSVTGDQAQPLYNALNQIGAQAPALSGDVAPVATALGVNIALLTPLKAFIDTSQAVDTLLWLLYVSLAVAGLVTIVLAARMVVLRRSAELTMRRARGASLRQIAATVTRGAAIACVPAAVAAVVLAVLLVPGPAPAGGWWPPAAAAAIALFTPAVVAVWQQRLPRHRARGQRRPRARTRLVVEATAVAAAIAGVIVFRQEGTQAGSGVNLYTSAAPVLVAVPVVIVVLRLYPLVLRGLLRGSARRRGAAAFLGLARAARTVLTPALPAFALVLALTVAAFAGMVRDAVTRGEVAASWQAAGADVTVSTSSAFASSEVITAAMQRAVAAVPGVSRTTAVWTSLWTAPSLQQVTVVAVDPASYAALVSGTQTFPQVQAGLLAAASPQAVLASPLAASEFGASRAGTLTTETGAAPVSVRIAGVLSGTPAVPGNPAFVIMPLSAIHYRFGPIPLNEMLVTGENIDRARVFAVLRSVLPQATTTLRSDMLTALTGAPLQHGTFVLFELAVAAAAVLGLAVMLLELALGAADREETLARLAAMGLEEGQRVRVVTLEVLPAVIAAGVAAVTCALVLPRVVAPALDLSVFTGSLATVVLAPDTASFAVPLAGLAVVAVIALGLEIRAGRRHGVTGSLRAGE